MCRRIDWKSSEEVLEMLFFEIKVSDLVASELGTEEGTRVFPLLAVGGELG